MAKLTHKDLEEFFRVEPGERARLKDRDPAWMGTPALRELGKDAVKEKAKAYLDRTSAELFAAQELLWATDRYSVLVVLQAMDAAGKDGTIKHVMGGLNPQGCAVHSFKQPSSEELDHSFLWRYAKRAPRKGEVTVFNRSHYEDVLVTKVHPALLDKAKLPEEKRGKSFWKARYDDINAFERHLARNGTVILKFFLHLSKEEQRKRLLARLDDSAKQWKFSLADVAERAHWDDYQEAFEDAIEATGTEWAPWWVVPADHKFVTRFIVAATLIDAIESLGLEAPKVSAEQRAKLKEARATLDAEG